MKHHLMIGTWTPPGAIFTVAFDDEALTLELVKRTPIPEDEPISWMAFDVRTPHSCLLHDLTSPKHKKKNIYGAAMKKWSSFRVDSPTSIIHTSSHPMDHDRERLLLSVLPAAPSNSLQHKQCLPPCAHGLSSFSLPTLLPTLSTATPSTSTPAPPPYSP